MSTTLNLAPPPTNRPTTGWLAAAGAVAIWGGWIVFTRKAVAHAMDSNEIALLRFGIPMVLLAPVCLRIGIWPRGMTIPRALGLLGSGAPFTLLAAAAMRSVPAAEVGPLLPGFMPLVVALLSAIVFGEKLGALRWGGAALVACGVLAIVGVDFRGGLAGHALLMTAACEWAIYTLVFKRSGLTAIESTALVALWSTLIALPYGVPALLAHIEAGGLRDMAFQALLQGVLSGVVAIVLYGVAIERLGSSRAAAPVALVPGLAAVLAIPVNGEWPTPIGWLGVCTATIGVALLSGLGDALVGSIRSGRPLDPKASALGPN